MDGPNWGKGGGARLLPGGGQEEGRHCNDFFTITHIVHKQKTNGGSNGEGGHGPPRTPIVMPLIKADKFNIKGSK